MMKSINLENIPSDFRDQRDIHTALAWNAVKKVLIDKDREEIFSSIQSVRLTEKYIIITTHKPIVNAELLLFREDILERFHLSMKSF